MAHVSLSLRSCLAGAVILASGGCVSVAQGEPTVWRRVVLLELFTSQGCSSCPPADLLVAQLPAMGLGRDRVLPLTFHVDYWDELGWKDPFASPEFTARQRWYARAGFLRTPTGTTTLTGLYTPQMVVGGKVHFSGQQRTVALDALREAARSDPRLDLTATTRHSGDELLVAVQVAPRAGFDRAGDWRLVLALAARSASTHVLRGENAGRTLEQAALVRALSDPVPLPAPGSKPAQIRLHKPGDTSWQQVELAAFVQSQTTGEVAATLAFAPDP